MKSKEALNNLYEFALSSEPMEIIIKDFKDIIEKDLDVLQQYKKIEKELGIDLITLFRFFKKEMVFKTDDGYPFHTYPNNREISLARTNCGWALKLRWFRDYDYYYLKDFNKTFRFSTKTAIGKYWAKRNGGTEF